MRITAVEVSVTTGTPRRLNPSKIAPLNKPDLMNAVYLMWGVPTVIYLIASSFGRRIILRASVPRLDQPAVASRAVA
jgi:hypothetical protein